MGEAMKVTVRDVLKIASAQIEVSPIALLAGPNEAGKSSILQAIAAAAVGTPYIRGITRKGDLGRIVRHGSDNGAAWLEGESGQCKLSWPDGEYTSKSAPPSAVAEAVGLSFLLDMKPKDRAARMIEILDAEPSFADFEAALEEQDIQGEVVTKAWAELQQQGWDGFWKMRQEYGVKMKGRWEQITGAGNFGVKKARGWVPDDWDMDLDNETFESLTQVYEAAKVATDKATRAAAVSGEQRAAMVQAADLYDQRSEQTTAKLAVLSAADDEIKGLVAKRNNLGPTEKGPLGLLCPHECCKAAERRLVLVHDPDSGRVSGLGIPGAQPSDEEIKANRLEAASIDGKLSNLRGTKGELHAELAVLDRELRDSKQAREALVDLPEAGGDEAEVEKAKAAEIKAEHRRDLHQQRAEAAEVYRRIVANQKLIDVLAPGGVRETVLSRKVLDFGAQLLVPLSQAAGLRETVTLDVSTFDLRYGTESYQSLSQGAQHLCEVVLQIAIAKYTGSALIIVDDNDVLDEKNAGRLVGLCRAARMPAVLAFATTIKERVPNLKAKNAGTTYWVEDGNVSAL